MRTVLALLLCLGLVGCATTGYYTNPNSAGYYQQVFGGLCESCGRVFTMTAEQLNSLENIQCPYCGTIQNTKMASNRYTYMKQQQEAQNTMRFFGAIRKDIQEDIERRQEINRSLSQEVLQGFRPQPSQPYQQQPKGTFSDPFHIKVED